MTDIYSWILSPEVREHLRKTYPLSTLDKTRLICGAFRSIEEKETALRALLEEVEPGEDRERLTKLVRLYGLALEELRTTGPEALFVKTADFSNIPLTISERLLRKFTDPMFGVEMSPFTARFPAVIKWLSGGARGHGGRYSDLT